jgi:hypothetical protein
MTTQAFIVVDATQKAAAEALNDQDAAVYARLIDNSLANNLGYGTLYDDAPDQRFVIPARVLNDPLYTRWVSSLGVLSIYVMDSDTIFLPEEE